MSDQLDTNTSNVPPAVQAEFDAWLDEYAERLTTALREPPPSQNPPAPPPPPPVQPKGDFKPLPGGGIVLRGDGSHQNPQRVKKGKAWWISETPSPAPPAPSQNPEPGPWQDIDSMVQRRERVVNGLGEFPQRMLKSPLVEGRLKKS